MTIVIEVSTIKYEDHIPLIKKAMINLESICDVQDGFVIGEPTSKFGWTFFQLAIRPSLLYGIEKKFSDMLQKAKGHKPNEKFANFMSDYFAAKGSEVRLKITEF